MILLALAIAPGLAIAIYVYWKDKYDKEPMKYLIISFLLGIVSAIPAVIASLTAEKLLPNEKTPLHQATQAFLAVALWEEFFKFLFVRMYAYRKEAFNEPYDGITYSVMVSMGFATIENILYSFQGGMGIALMRMFTAVPAHATFGIVMGYYLGLAKFKQGQSLKYMILAVGAATVMHGTYDACLFINSYPALALGAIASLIIGIVYSKKAMRIHQEQSPFKVVRGQ